MRAFALASAFLRMATSLSGPISVDRAIAITRAFQSRSFPLKVHFIIFFIQESKLQMEFFLMSVAMMMIMMIMMMMMMMTLFLLM